MNKKLLILDLDETLIHARNTPLERPPDFTVRKYVAYRRPFLDEFLTTVFEWFDVAVWSSGGSTYVESAIQIILKDYPAPKFIWSNEKCTRRRHWPPEDRPSENEYYDLKNLKKVKNQGFALEHVLMIDDSPEKLQNHYGNYINVTSFIGDLNDTELKDILPFLNSLRNVENVRTIEKRYWRKLIGDKK